MIIFFIRCDWQVSSRRGSTSASCTCCRRRQSPSSPASSRWGCTCRTGGSRSRQGRRQSCCTRGTWPISGKFTSIKEKSIFSNEFLALLGAMVALVAVGSVSREAPGVARAKVRWSLVAPTTRRQSESGTTLSWRQGPSWGEEGAEWKKLRRRVRQ